MFAGLVPLRSGSVSPWLADALPVAPESVSTLRGLVMERTLGNPYQVLERAREAVREMTQTPSDSADSLASLQTRLATFSRAGLGALLNGRLLALGRPARTLVQIAIGLGHEFSFATLAAVTSWTAAFGKRRGLARRMHRLVEIDAFAASGSGAAGSPAALVIGLDTRFAFGHDRLHQAGHGLLDKEQRRITHRPSHVHRPVRRSKPPGPRPPARAARAISR